MDKLKCNSLFFRKASESDQPVTYPALSKKISKKMKRKRVEKSDLGIKGECGNSSKSSIQDLAHY